MQDEFVTRDDLKTPFKFWLDKIDVWPEPSKLAIDPDKEVDSD